MVYIFLYDLWITGQGDASRVEDEVATYLKVKAKLEAQQRSPKDEMKTYLRVKARLEQDGRLARDPRSHVVSSSSRRLLRQRRWPN